MGRQEPGFIEGLGERDLAHDGACEGTGFETPVLDDVGTHFRVTLLAGVRRSPRLDELDRAILSALRGTDGLATSQIAEVIRRSSRATRTRLASLVERGLVVELATGRHDPRRRYLAAEEAS